MYRKAAVHEEFIEMFVFVVSAYFDVASCVCLQVQQPAFSLSEHTHCETPTSISSVTVRSVLHKTD